MSECSQFNKQGNIISPKVQINIFSHLVADAGIRLHNVSVF